MDALPDDVLLLILGRFHGAKELAQLASVCKRWCQLCSQVPTLTMVIPPAHSTDAVKQSLLESVLSARVGLRKLDVRDWVAVGFRNLKSLDHHASTIESLTLCLPQAAMSIATEFPKLSYLDIQVRDLVSGLDGFLFRNLHECRLDIGSGISSSSVESLLKACPALSTLRVTCWGSPLSLDSKTLQHLTVVGADSTVEVMELRMPSLKKLSLNNLSLSKCTVQNAFSWSDLQVCGLSGVAGIFGATVEALVKNSPMLRRLKTYHCPGLCSPRITLESTSLKDLSIVGIKRIEAVELRTCNLEKLCLSHCVERVTFHGEGLESMARIGKLLRPVSTWCPSLKEMKIWIPASDSTMNFQHLVYLIDFLKGSPFLTQLTLHASDSWDGALEELKKDPRFNYQPCS